MSDRIPGSSPYNPIQYRGWNISLCACGGSDVMGSSHAYEFVHEDYDPTPQEPGDGPGDNRCGHEASIEAAKRAIDEFEDDKPVCAHFQSDGRDCCRNCGHFHGPDGAA